MYKETFISLFNIEVFVLHNEMTFNANVSADGRAFFLNNYIISPCQERLQFNARRMYGELFYVP